MLLPTKVRLILEVLRGNVSIYMLITKDCRRCSNYIFIIDLAPGLHGLGKDKYNARRETFMFWELVCLILGFWL